MIDFKKIPNQDKPRERLYVYGSENLSNEELISIILRTGTKNMSVKEVSLKLLESIGDISKLKDIGINTLVKIDGIGRVKAIEIKAALELGRRVYVNSDNIDKISFNSALSIYEYFYNILVDKKQEYFYTVYVDNKGKYIDKKCLFVGTINSSLVHPREIFKEAYLLSASGIICVHNHPSGDSSPSKEDKMITKKIKEISLIHGINFIDHIIIGNGNYFSFYDNNML
ncbi:MAG: DNA repair protein RadC [Bacilli bacterium]|nr:DNA repair protein RadC [Bacilli bacterium]